MAQTIVELPSGGKVVLGGGGVPVGLTEVSLTSKLNEVSATQFQGAMTTLGELVGMLEHAVGALAKRPDKVEIEFSASISGECDLYILAGDAEAEFKVTLAWGKSD